MIKTSPSIRGGFCYACFDFVLRIIIASIIGATYTIIMYLNILPIYSNFFMKILLSLVIVYIALKPKNLKIFCNINVIIKKQCIK